MSDDDWSHADLAQGLRELADYFEGLGDEARIKYGDQGLRVNIQAAGPDALEAFTAIGFDEDPYAPPQYLTRGFGPVRGEDGPRVMKVFHFPMVLTVVDGEKVGVAS